MSDTSSTTGPDTQAAPADAIANSWVDKAPGPLIPFLQLSRYDRPIGFWLLAAPCWVGMAFARMQTGWTEKDILKDIILALAFFVGALAMRGAGCTWNDMLDRKIDAKVARTAGRPLPSGRVSMRGAALWLGLQCLFGVGVLVLLAPLGQIIALAALPMVALYPLMKRITWWPQAWLGLTFNWGALVAPATLRGDLALPDILVFLGLALWTVGYDTIYALQDTEDDALIGVRSTARLFGERAQLAVFIIYGLSVTLLAVSCILAHETAGLLGCVLFAGHLSLQAAKVPRNDAGLALSLFKSNRDAVMILTACWIGAAIWF